MTFQLIDGFQLTVLVVADAAGESAHGFDGFVMVGVVEKRVGVLMVIVCTVFAFFRAGWED